MNAKFWLLPILLSSIKAITINFSGAINGSVPVQYYSSNISAGNSIMSVGFKVTNIKYSNTIMYVNFSPLLFNLTSSQISSYFQSNSPVLTYMDAISAMGGNPQLINLYIPINKDMFYITILNLDGPQLDVTKYYQLQINLISNIYYCYTCPAGSSIVKGIPLSCQCSPCPANYIGVTCSYYLQKLSSSVTFSITNNLSKYFVMGNTGQSIDLVVQQLTNTSTVYLYVQYQYNNKMIAGKLNTYYKNQNTSYEYQITNKEKVVSIPSLGLNILLTVQNYGGIASKISIIYPSKQSFSITHIIIAICVSIIGFIIILVIVMRIRKRYAQRNSIINVNMAVINNQNSLTDRQIQKMFPQVQALNIFSIDINSSASEVNINNDHINEQEMIVQCSICFDHIKKSDFIRVTYCRHIFHAKCLLQWFRKNPSCPNCRQHFDIKTTKQFRQKYPRSVKSKPNQLIKAILGDNFFDNHKRTKIDGETELKKINEAQIQSKQLNIPQNQQSNT